MDPRTGCILLVLSLTCQDAFADIPEQIHISFGDNESSMVVMWASHDLVNGYVKYGKTASDLSMSSAGSEIIEMPPQSFNALKYIHRVQLENLSPGTTYFYRVCLEDDGNATEPTDQSDVFSFITLRENTTVPAKYIVYGDMGIQASIPTYGVLEKLLMSRDYTGVWHVGDMGYDLHSDNGRVGDDFLRKIQPFAAFIPYMTAPGNHEIPDDFVNYRTRFSMPGVPWPMPINRMWYSYNIGLVHFISFSSEVYFTYNEDFTCEQFHWLRGDLVKANENRDKVPWIIALGHRPMYCSNNNGDDCTNRFFHRWLRYGLEDLFHAQGVDMVIEAHEHSYERLWPVYKGQVAEHSYINPQATVHVITGAAGNGEGVDWMSRHGTIQNEWSAFRADELSKFTFGKLVIQNRTHILFEQIQATTLNVIDSFWIQQTNHGPFVKNVTCSGSENLHPSCVCPPPIRYMLYFILAIVGGCVLVIGIITVIVTYLFKRHYRKTPKDIEGLSLIAGEHQEEYSFERKKHKTWNVSHNFR